MKSHRLLVAPAVVAAALAAIMGAAPAAATTIDLKGTPNDGMVCRAGYIGSVNSSGAFLCSKQIGFNVGLICPVGNFTNYISRTKFGSRDGKDLCIKTGDKAPSITSDSSISGMTEGTDFVYAIADTAGVKTKLQSKGHDEAVALGLADSEVEAQQLGPISIIVDNNGIKDQTGVSALLYTFANKTTGFVSSFPLVK